MIGFIPLPGSDDFLCAANDNGEHRPPPFRVVMEARKRLAKIRKERADLLVLAYLLPKGRA